MVEMIITRDVDASGAAVFAMLADYWARPALLPTSFTDYGIKRGGHGAGTRVRYRLHAGGRVRDCRVEVTEPVAGRELLETDTSSSLRTRWIIEPLAEKRCRVSVETRWTSPGGIGGWIERVLATRRIRHSYNHALDRLARQVLT